MTGQMTTSKILARAAGQANAASRDVLLPAIDLMTCLDGTTFIDGFNQEHLTVWDPQKVIFCFDHSFQPDWMPVAAITEHQKIRQFARQQGIPTENVYDLDRNGISHHIAVEQGWALPGTVCMGTDTQSSTMGAVHDIGDRLTLRGISDLVTTGDQLQVDLETVRSPENAVTT